MKQDQAPGHAPYLNAEQSAKLMRSLAAAMPETADERFIRLALEERSEGRDDVDTDYHRLAVDLAGALRQAVHQRAELVTMLTLLTEKGTKQATGMGWNVRLKMARDLIAKIAADDAAMQARAGGAA